MDKSEGQVLAGIPADALSLKLSRSTIKMRHTSTWRVEKSNEVHDLVVCISGGAHYELDGEAATLSPGEAMLIPAGARFVGRIEQGPVYSGFAQHFTLDLFGHVDLISQMDLKRTARFSRWEVIEPLVRHYRDTSPVSATTLAQYHLFMVILIEYIEEAFIRWREQALINTAGPDALSLHVMLTAARITGNPFKRDILNEALGKLPYNADYFRRAFKERLGYTPTKFLEFKRLEQAMNILAAGHSVKETAALTGYPDVYYFSRQFKRYIGTSPSAYRLRNRAKESGQFIDGSFYPADINRASGDV
ncbi:AraC family transcriptional regulator [Pelagibacterium lentulum]|uniref:AraC family transcriptional regulator n=1 Tax=Pelagibacterium lentulum TaxID=2029865 RepID=A0A916RJ48_9HYPH|nr:AraC family transcriptional regulator [Pelagibacterium lentulum]GGA59297.1 AraC family transcriptional regulator [Pelagibacterium lentulum]